MLRHHANTLVCYFTSEIGTTSLQGTKLLSPKCPLLGGSTVLILSRQMRQLCVDKELLMCRNRSLTAELHSREAVKTGGGGGGGGGGEGTAGSWLISCSSEYEVMMM